MDFNIWHVNEYAEDSRQGNEFAPEWPFRIVVSGSSDSGKTTMIMNLLKGNKKIKEDGEKYVLCNDVVLIGKHLNEPKWGIVRDFYNELAEEGEDVSFHAILPADIPDVEEFDSGRATVVIFEDLMNMPKKVQNKIADYFSSGRHSNISPIYVSQRFFAIPKTVRENINYISLHRGAGSLPDIKRIISQYTDQSASLAPAIDELTLKKEFIVFDLRRSQTDPLSIRVRWDTNLRSILDQSQINHRSVIDQSQIDQSSVNVLSVMNSRFSSYGQKAIAEAKKNGLLAEFAQNFPSPKERKILLADKVNAKNKDNWVRLVFREAYRIEGKDLGPEWTKFLEQIKGTPVYNKKSCLSLYKKLLESRPIDDKKYNEGCNALLWLLSNGHINRKTFCIAISELS
jgi:predicted XRE-type DNA-binding protein